MSPETKLYGKSIVALLSLLAPMNSSFKYTCISCVVSSLYQLKEHMSVVSAVKTKVVLSGNSSLGLSTNS